MHSYNIFCPFLVSPYDKPTDLLIMICKGIINGIIAITPHHRVIHVHHACLELIREVTMRIFIGNVLPLKVYTA